MNGFGVVGILLAFFAGMFYTVATFLSDRGRKRDAWGGRVMCAFLMALALALVCVPPAKAAEIMEIRDVAVLTDERGQCPRNHAIAIFPDRVRGCWTIGEHDRITRIYRGGKLIAEYSSLRLEIYGRLL